jgi:transcriptional regulator with XRE-family HTH domain
MVAMRTELLKTARKRKRLTLEQLALLAGIDHSTISRMERGKTQPMYDTVKKLEKALGCALRFDRQPRRAA